MTHIEKLEILGQFATDDDVSDMETVLEMNGMDLTDFLEESDSVRENLMRQAELLPAEYEAPDPKED